MKILSLAFVLLFLSGCASQIKIKSEEVQREVAKRSKQINSCYYEAHQRAVDIYKPITIKFIIGNLGGVRSAHTFKNETGDEKLGKCIAKEFTYLKFKVEKGHTNYRYLFTLNYNPRYK